MDFLAQDAFSSLAGIDRDHPVAALHQIFECKKARPVILRRNPDHGDGLHRIENATNVGVVVSVVVHLEGNTDFFATAARRLTFSVSSSLIFACTAANASPISASVKRVTICEEQFTSHASTVNRIARSGRA